MAWESVLIGVFPSVKRGDVKRRRGVGILAQNCNVRREAVTSRSSGNDVR